MSASIDAIATDSFDELLDALPQEIGRILSETARVALDSAEANLSGMDWDTRSLARSGHIEAEEGAESVVYDARHAHWVEFGRPPGIRPPVQSVFEYLMERGIKSRPLANRIARRFCDRVEAKGMEPQPFLRPARARAEQHLNQEAARLEEQLRRRGVKT